MPNSTKSKMNDIYNEIFKPLEQLSKEKPSIINSLMQYTNRSSNRNSNVVIEQSSPKNNKITRAKSQICSLLGDEDTIRKGRVNKNKIKDTHRISLIKTEMNQILKKKESCNKVTSIPMSKPIPIPMSMVLPISKRKPSSERYLSLGKTEVKAKNLIRNENNSYTINESNIKCSKYQKEEIINKTDLLFQLKLGLTKI